MLTVLGVLAGAYEAWYVLEQDTVIDPAARGSADEARPGLASTSCGYWTPVWITLHATHGGGDPIGSLISPACHT